MNAVVGDRVTFLSPCGCHLAGTVTELWPESFQYKIQSESVPQRQYIVRKESVLHVHPVQHYSIVSALDDEASCGAGPVSTKVGDHWEGSVVCAQEKGHRGPHMSAVAWEDEDDG